MQYPTDKQGRSIKQLALLKQFAHDSFVDLPKEGAHAYAELIYDRMEEAECLATDLSRASSEDDY